MRCHLSSTLTSSTQLSRPRVGVGGSCGTVGWCGHVAELLTRVITPLWSSPPVLSTCPTGILSQVPAGMLLKMVLLVQGVRERVGGVAPLMWAWVGETWSLSIVGQGLANLFCEGPDRKCAQLALWARGSFLPQLDITTVAWRGPRDMTQTKDCGCDPIKRHL